MMAVRVVFDLAFALVQCMVVLRFWKTRKCALFHHRMVLLVVLVSGLVAKAVGGTGVVANELLSW